MTGQVHGGRDPDPKRNRRVRRDNRREARLARGMPKSAWKACRNVSAS